MTDKNPVREPALNHLVGCHTPLEVELDFVGRWQTAQKVDAQHHEVILEQGDFLLDLILVDR